MTKLESLVESLKGGEYESLIDDLILNYFADQDRESFEIDEEIFLVYTREDQNEILYDRASDMFDEKMGDLDALMDDNNFYLGFSLGKCLRDAEAISQIIRTLNFADEQELIEIGETRDHYVYKV